MTKLVEIENCADCPNCLYENSCFLTNRHIKNINRIPKWCPLPDTDAYNVEQNIKNVTGTLIGITIDSL